MTLRATPISTSAKAVLIAAAFSLAVPASAQMTPDDPDAEDIARQPLRDLNIDREGIPVALQNAMSDSYASEGLNSCNDIVGEVAALDQVLGADFDIADNEDGGGINPNRVARSLVGSLIPFRSIVREITGARDREREVELAVIAGVVRRGFLKGLGQQRGCSYPARPRENRGTLTASE